MYFVEKAKEEGAEQEHVDLANNAIRPRDIINENTVFNNVQQVSLLRLARIFKKNIKFK